MCNAWNHSPGCDCGWGGNGWSGGYGWPSSSGWQPVYTTTALPRASHLPRSLPGYSYGRQDVCFPTACPECGESVYFVRHNDGCAWFDSLGWPWPKHRHCNDDQDYLNLFFATIRARPRGVEAAPILGRILKRIHHCYDVLYIVATESGQLAVFAGPPGHRPLLSGIVLVRFTVDGLLLEDTTHNALHVKDAHIDPRVLESYLHEPSLDLQVGWQYSTSPPRSSRSRKH